MLHILSKSFVETRNVSLLTDSESHPRPSPDLINSNTCLKLRPGPEHRLGAASISAITRHDYPETEEGGETADTNIHSADIY